MLLSEIYFPRKFSVFCSELQKSVSVSLGQVQTDFLLLTYTIRQEISHLYFPVYFYLGSQITAIKSLVLGSESVGFHYKSQEDKDSRFCFGLHSSCKYMTDAEGA